jgi:hypothetical protein
LVAAFHDAGATSAETAIDYVPDRRLQRRYLASLIGHGAIVETSAGRFYLNEAKLKAHTARRRKTALGLGMLAAIVAAVAIP